MGCLKFSFNENKGNGHQLKKLLIVKTNSH